jgi:N6-adenosine-specific RNA methylase IME4
LTAAHLPKRAVFIVMDNAKEAALPSESTGTRIRIRGQGLGMAAPRPTWRNYIRGLKAEAATDVLSSCLEFERPPMSKTRQNGRASSQSAGRKAGEPSDLFSASTDRVQDQARTPGNSDLSPPKQSSAALDLIRFAQGRRFATILADPPWQFTNKTGKVAPEHKRLSRYGTMNLADIMALPVEQLALPTSHLYLWCPNAMLPEGLAVMKAWGFTYKSNIVWHKVRKDGGSDGRGVGFYFRNVTELILFGVRGKNARTLAPGRRQVNLLATRKREHSRKPDEQYQIIEACSRAAFLELFARGKRDGWTTWGNQADDDYRPTWKTDAHHSRAGVVAAE